MNKPNLTQLSKETNKCISCNKELFEDTPYCEEHWEQDVSEAFEILSNVYEEDEYIEESRCVRCEQEISNEEDINNLGMCDICWNESRYTHSPL